MAELEGQLPAQAFIETRSDATGAPVVCVTGDLDMSNAEQLEATVASVAGTGAERLIFDLSELRFMDSAGIAVLLGAVSKVRAVVLRQPSPAVRRVVELTGLTDVLPIEP